MRDDEKGADDEKDDRNEKEKENIPKLIRHFLAYTTAHGIGRLADNLSIFWKIFWSIVCLGSFAMFVHQAHGLFEIYFSRPVTTSVRITFEKRVPFPAVTICNLNMIQSHLIPKKVKNEISNTEAFQTINKTYNAAKAQARRRRDLASPASDSTSSTTKEPSRAAEASSENLTTSDPTAAIHNGYISRPVSEYDTPSITYVPSYVPSYYYSALSADEYGHVDTELLPQKEELDEQTFYWQTFVTVVTRVAEDELKKAGHQFENFVVNCSWRGLECKTSNFSKWWSQSWNYKYGNCFTFNGGIDKHGKPIRVLSTTKPGPSQGLLLRLNIEQEKYIKTISSEAGVRVMLHDQGVMPFPFEEGFSVSPGMSTSVGIQKTVISRVDRFGNQTCLDIDELDKDNIYSIHRNITKYTPQTCQNSCLGKTQFEECGCSEYLYPSSEPACDSFNNTIRECLLDVYYSFNNDISPCLDDCRQPCTENVIQKSISMSQWPSAEFESFKKSRDSNYSSKDNLMLNVFYNELNYQRIEETFTYDKINLLADIGGQLGLWIGVSVITCCETLELFMLMAAHVARKLRAKYRVGNKQ